MVGNKSDLNDNREVTYEEAKEFADAKELIYIEVSAKKTINIDSIFETLTTDLVKNTVNHTLSNKKNIPNTTGYISLIEKENIKMSYECTFCEKEKYFSYRRDKPEEIEAMLAYITIKD